MSPEDYDAILRAPGFALGIRCRAGELTAIDFLPPEAGARAPRSEPARRALDQLAAYIEDPAARFDLPLAPAGTAFQRRVWREISAIPGGQTRSYGELARALSSAARAVGQACGANPYPIVVPCHRVVSSAGMGGFAHARDGLLLGIKRWLLEHERRG